MSHCSNKPLDFGADMDNDSETGIFNGIFTWENL